MKISMKRIGFIISIITFLSITMVGCDRNNNEPPESIYNDFITENVIIVVIDGPRYSESWGDSTHANIPRMKNDLSPIGVINTSFYNNGVTYTNNGHSALTTGNYQEIDNTGLETPFFPSLFQYWRHAKGASKNKSWVITSKDKLHVLSNCIYPGWNDKYSPAINCGVGEDGSGGYRHDSITFNRSMSILSAHHPNLSLINFREPDYSGHKNDWAGYIQGIKDTDEYIYKIWSFIESDPIYSGKTTLIVTNDHGRHLDGVENGFISHGCDCMGCKKINFLAIGPDIKKNIVFNKPRELTDISATVAHLLNFQMPTSNGSIMHELFK